MQNNNKVVFAIYKMQFLREYLWLDYVVVSHFGMGKRKRRFRRNDTDRRGGMYRSAESALVCMMADQAILYT